MSKILVTGSEGVVGKMLCKILRERGHDVFGIDLMHKAGEVGFEHQMGNITKESPWDYARCDVADYRQLVRIFDTHTFDFVYHAAAEFGRWNGEDFYEQVWRTNAIGTKNIIRLQEILKFKLIFFSSSEVYGDFPGIMGEEVMGTFPIRQMNDYALSKWVNETQIRNSALETDTESVIVRLFNTYGPGETYHPYRSVNAKFCYHALHGLPVKVYTGHYRTSTFLEDTCCTLANIVTNFKAGEIYNIGGTEYHSIEDLVKIIWDYTGADKDLIISCPAEVQTTKVKQVDTTKAMRDLGHKPTTTLADGVKKTIDWMKEYYG